MKKSKIAIIKCRTLELRANKQIPLILAKMINDLTGKEETKYIQFLLEMSTHLLRVKNYYKLYPDAEKEANVLILDGLTKLGF